VSAPPALRPGSASGGRGLSFGACGAFAQHAGLSPGPPASQAGTSNPAVPILNGEPKGSPFVVCRWPLTILLARS